MNRHVCRAAVLAAALAAVASRAGYAQVPVTASRSIEATWRAERAFHLSRVMDRASATMAGNAESVKVLADLKALVAADAKRTTRPATDERFDTGFLTAWERDAMYRVVVRLLVG
jgi:hypothetical protein